MMLFPDRLIPVDDNSENDTVAFLLSPQSR